MCGRFDNLIARDAYRGLFKVGRLPKSNFPPRYNIAATDQIPIVRIDSRDGEREVAMARWGDIVGEANPLVGGVHDRMPMMLMSEDCDRWLGLLLPSATSKHC
jgi:putative SOS response-associated peptidase YedK